MLLPDHSPEVPESFGERALGGNVGVLAAVAIDVVGVDVVAARDTCATERARLSHVGFQKRKTHRPKWNHFAMLVLHVANVNLKKRKQRGCIRRKLIIKGN